MVCFCAQIILVGNNSTYTYFYNRYNSHAVPVEVQVGIARLEIPLDLKVSSSDVPKDLSITVRDIYFEY